ncbi:hypothetical protein [Amycolatopsis lexingtonensis]|uniref:hypothetical protein n=1 Tax=Amycolatopsis lexingtonensis TaxID=218822 RepID=UPI003F730112
MSPSRRAAPDGPIPNSSSNVLPVAGDQVRGLQQQAMQSVDDLGAGPAQLVTAVPNRPVCATSS